MDCDDVMLMLANDEQRTLTGVEEHRLREHLETCDGCRQLAHEAGRRVATPSVTIGDAPAAPVELTLPLVDPDHYIVDGEIASGGMGRISRAEDRRLGREVALKEVLEPTLHARFEREALITARLQHPAIVPIYEAGVWPSGAPFYAMRLVAGTNLAEVISDTPTLEERIALLGHVVAATDALAYAHSQGIIHRDLKPANILVDDFGGTVVIDWGLAKQLDDDRDDAPDLAGVESATSRCLTRMGSVLGTPGFMSPEQARGGAMDERTDVYALGAILYNVLVGAPPYWDTHRDKDADHVVEVSQLRSPTPLATLVPGAPTDLCTIVERAMARRPEDRFPSAREMAAELRRFQAGKLIATHAYTIRELTLRWLRRHRAVVAVATIAMGALVGTGIYAVQNVRRARDRATSALRAEQASAGALLEEQGRAEVLAQAPERATVYLAAAMHRGRETPSLRHLLASATRNLDLLQETLPGELRTMGFAADGALVTVARSGRVEVRENGRVRSAFSLPRPPGVVTLDRAGARLVDARTGGLELWDIATSTRLWEVVDPALIGGTIIDGRDAGRPLTNPPDVLWSPTGERLAITSGVDGVLEVVEASTGARHRIDDAVVAVEWSRDGHLLATARSDGMVAIRDATTGAVEGSVATRLQPTCLAFLGERQVVIGGESGAARWSIGEPTIDSFSSARGVRSIAVSADRAFIAIADAPDSIRLFSATGGSLARVTTGASTQQLAFASDGDLMATVGNRTQIWSPPMLDPVLVLDRTDVMIVDDTRPRIATHHDATIRVWSLPRSSRIARAPGRSGIGGSSWLTLTPTETVVRSIEDGHVVRTLPPVVSDASIAATLVVSHDGQRAIYMEESEQRPRSIDLQTGMIAELPTESPVVSADGRVAVEVEKTLRVLDATTGAVLRTIVLPEEPSAAALSPRGDRLAVVGTNVVTLWDTSTGSPQATYPIAATASDLVVFDEAGTSLIVGEEGSVAVIDLRSGARRTIAVDGSIAAVVPSADVRRLVVASDLSTRLWDVATGRLLSTAPPSEHVAITSDGARFALVVADGIVEMWSDTGRVLGRYHAHRGVRGLSIGADDSRLLVVGSDRTSTLFDTRLDVRDLATIDALVAKLPWQFDAGLVVPR